MRKQAHSPKAIHPTIRAEWLAVLVGLLLCVLVSFLYWTLEQREQINFSNKLKVEAEYLAANVDGDLRSRISALQRMARRWEIHGDMTKEEFIQDAKAYLYDTPGFQALEWVDADYMVRWIVPIEGNEKAQNLNLALDSKRRISLEKAKATGSPTMTGAMDLAQRRKVFLVYFPIYVKGENSGFLLAVFRIHEWLDYVFGSEERKVYEDVRISVAFDGITALTQLGWDQLAQYGLETSATRKIQDHHISISLRPTDAYIQQNKTQLPKVVAVFGFILSILATFIVYLLQKAFRETWATQAAKTALEAEIQEHAKTADELEYALSRLELATRAGGIGVWVWELSTNALVWNERMYRLYDIPTDIQPVYNTWRSAVHPDDLQATESLLQNAVQGKAVFNTEFRILTSSGAVRYLGAAASVEREFNGKPQRVTGINWDMTDWRHTEEALKQSEERVRFLLNSTAEAIYGLDLEGNCTFANASCLKLLGYTTAEELLGKNMHQLIHYCDSNGKPMPAEQCRIYDAIRASKGMHVDDEVLWRANGSSFPAEYWSYPQIVNGKVAGAVVTFIDITRRKEAEQSAAAERERLEYILEGTNVGTYEWNIATGETIHNARWAEIIGYTLEDLAPVSIDTFKKFAHPDDLKIALNLIDRHFRKELAYYECEVRMRHKNGNWIWVLDRGKVARWGEDGKPVVMCGTHQDITQRKLVEEQVAHMANHDGLTDLPSLRLAMERLVLSLSMARRHKTMAAVMFIDLDGFKTINDTLGHDAGDYVLKQVAQRMLSCVRETDTVARVGGDEFLFIAGELQSSENAALIAGKITHTISQPILFDGQRAMVGASIGISLFPRDGDTADTLVKSADEAMYEVKNSGKNGYRFVNPAK